jgi:hypothetical protein
LFAGRHEALREVFEELRRSISQRWPQTKWRDLKQYIAALAEGQTFLAVYPRAGGLVMGLSLPKEATHERLADNQREFHWTRITKIAHVSSAGEIDESLLQLIESARNYASDLRRTNSYFGITLRDLIAAQLLRPHTRLVLSSGSRDVATATLTESGELLWQDKSYRSLSDRVFADLLGRRSVNGWTSWYAELPTGRVMLTTLRETLLRNRVPSDVD